MFAYRTIPEKHCTSPRIQRDVLIRKDGSSKVIVTALDNPRNRTLPMRTMPKPMNR